ncbi:MAG: hypothetical protein H0W88_01365 [Parachlamydiaceae bacterium]|nr:hypothetical protein [Parachlamydiaceae bacterium]
MKGIDPSKHRDSITNAKLIYHQLAPSEVFTSTSLQEDQLEGLNRLEAVDEMIAQLEKFVENNLTFKENVEKVIKTLNKSRDYLSKTQSIDLSPYLKNLPKTEELAAKEV